VNCLFQIHVYISQNFVNFIHKFTVTYTFCSVLLKSLPTLFENRLQISHAFVHTLALGANLPRDLLLRHLSNDWALWQRQTRHQLRTLKDALYCYNAKNNKSESNKVAPYIHEGLQQPHFVQSKRVDGALQTQELRDHRGSLVTVNK
jgi:hypothetical protein